MFPFESSDSQQSDGVVRVDSDPNDHSVTRHKPGLEALLRALGLDVVYHRGEGDLLYHRRRDGQEVEVVDFVGGYGALLFGHHSPEIVAAMTKFLASPQANHVQGSIRPRARQLADELNARSDGDYCTILANSGTEAVEAALKHGCWKRKDAPLSLCRVHSRRHWDRFMSRPIPAFASRFVRKSGQSSSCCPG